MGDFAQDFSLYNGQTKWNAPLRLDERGWAQPELGDLQPRLACRLVDAKDYAGDDAAVGKRKLAWAVLARAAALFSAADDRELWYAGKAGRRVARS